MQLLYISVTVGSECSKWNFPNSFYCLACLFYRFIWCWDRSLSSSLVDLVLWWKLWNRFTCFPLSLATCITTSKTPTFQGLDSINLDCISHETQIKVSAVLKYMVTVGSIDCAQEAALCKTLGQRSGLVFYPTYDVTSESGKVRACSRTLCFMYLLEYMR